MDSEGADEMHDESKDPLGLDTLIERTRTLLTAVPDLSVEGK